MKVEKAARCQCCGGPRDWNGLKKRPWWAFGVHQKAIEKALGAVLAFQPLACMTFGAGEGRALQTCPECNKSAATSAENWAL
eukprot:157536-Pelagomonas_calceolata.AAC.10